MRPLPEHLLALALAALTAAPPAGAQEEPPPWYRIELLVFRYTDPAAQAEEAWPVFPETAYPERYRFLLDRSLADRRLAAHPGAESRLDDQGRQTLELATPPLAPEAVLPPAELPDLLPLLPLEPQRPDGQVRAALPAPSEATADDPDPTAPPPRPPAFTPLDRRVLPAGRLAGDGAFEVLWHNAWLQPLPGEADAIPLLLDRSGDPDRTPWPRLQGSVRFYLSRYLHLETDLWLNTEGSYLPEGWRADAPPLAPPSLDLLEAPLPRRDPAEALLLGEPSRPDARLADASAVADTPSAPAGAEPSQTASPRPRDREQRTEPDAEPAWPWRHSIVLAAERRMRSGETHYIDHPLLGVVVRLEPLDDSALETLAEQLADPAWDARHGRSIVPGEAASPGEEP